MSSVLDGTTGITTPDLASGPVAGTTGTFSGALQASGVATNIYPLVLATAVASTSGTSVDFTSIPSWVKRITVMFQGVSQNSANQEMIAQIGAGSVTTTGYTSSSAFIAPSTASSTVTSGFPLNLSIGAGAGFSGVAVIASIGSNRWCCSATMGDVVNGQVHFGAGSITLGGTLDRVRLTMTSGTATFDAGTINILYEG